VKQTIQTTVNGVTHSLEVEPRKTLLAVLRDQLHLTGTKEGCSTGDCGACTVLMDGEPVTSCLVLAVEANGREIVTIEGIGQNGDLHPVQKALLDETGLQCGFCTPGMVISAVALLRTNPNPSEEEIRKGIAGNLCRCTGYESIVAAIRKAAREMRRQTRRKKATQRKSRAA